MENLEEKELNADTIYIIDLLMTALKTLEPDKYETTDVVAAINIVAVSVLMQRQ